MSARAFDQAAAAGARCMESHDNTHIMSCERTLRIGFFLTGLEDIYSRTCRPGESATWANST